MKGAGCSSWECRTKPLPRQQAKLFGEKAGASGYTLTSILWASVLMYSDRILASVNCG